jgi:hypothetical protein
MTNFVGQAGYLNSVNNIVIISIKKDHVIRVYNTEGDIGPFCRKCLY